MTTKKPKKKPPTDPIAAAARVIKIATGQSDEEPKQRIIVTFHSPAGAPEPGEKAPDDE